MQKVLVTGANGFVGSYTVRKLLEEGWQVIATGKGIARIPSHADHLCYESADFTHKEEVDQLLERHAPDIVIHCGALSAPDECEQNREAAFRTNVTGTLYLLQAAARFRSFFIFLSTDFVFSGETGMYKEDEERGPVNYYGQTKMMAEDEVSQYAFGWSIVRTVLVYGKPGLTRGNLLTNTASALREGRRLKIFSDQQRTPTWVEDLAAAIVTIANTRSEGIFHISGKDLLSPYDIAVEVARYLSLDETLIEPVVESEWPQPARRPPKTGFDISRARKELGYEPVSFSEGLKKTFE